MIPSKLYRVIYDFKIWYKSDSFSSAVGVYDDLKATHLYTPELQKFNLVSNQWEMVKL